METYEELKDANLQIIANLTPIQAYRKIGIVKDPTDPMPVEPPPLPSEKELLIMLASTLLITCDTRPCVRCAKNDTLPLGDFYGH